MTPPSSGAARSRECDGCAAAREHEEDDVRDVVGAHHPGERILCPPASRFEREVGGDAARADIRAADAAFAELVVEGTREADLANFEAQ